MNTVNKNFVFHLVSSLLIFLSVITTSNYLPTSNRVYSKTPTSSLLPTPTPFVPYPYSIPTIPTSRAYRIVIVGDSMVEALGPNAQLLRQHLIELYPDNEFVIYNYGFGATNIETLPDRLNKETTFNNNVFPSILSQGFDLIIIESFGYNPLSQEVKGEGLSKHLQILDYSIQQIILEKPESVIAIMATISPNNEYFAKGIYELKPEVRIEWVNERKEYIEGVIDFAQSKNIPLINIYEKSKEANGDGNPKYINPDDYIHPSALGIDFISKVTADVIYQTHIFPHL